MSIAPCYLTTTALQVLQRAVDERDMRVRGSHIESEKLRKHLAKQAAIWGNLQHDLGTLLQVPEAKGQRQQVGCILSALFEYNTLASIPDWLGGDGRSVLCITQWGYDMCAMLCRPCQG